MEETKVTLYSKQLDESREFGITHAQKIVESKNAGLGDWEVKDENFTEKDGTIKQRSTGPNKSTKAKEPTTEGSEA